LNYCFLSEIYDTTTFEKCGTELLNLILLLILPDFEISIWEIIGWGPIEEYLIFLTYSFGAISILKPLVNSSLFGEFHVSMVLSVGITYSVAINESLLYYSLLLDYNLEYTTFFYCYLISAFYFYL